MKNLKISFKAFVVVTIMLLAANVSHAQEKKSNGKAVIKTILNCDHCKECPTCGGKFKTEMLKIPGIKMYELDDKAMTFTVYYNPKKTTLQDIKVSISKLGYDADEVKATPEGIASLDGCCKI
ncbi:heavy-metal-associated domain-containing protein [Flavobacterium sp. 102]|jgi:copper chaperone CopZ|uniref:heavy-metal-associated domain-containing protein n=1 Tax=Flavobacterium sp. 102 TaxID=2135623 RepID=UPI000EAD5AAF|nr:heavy-metal-associated domain-containing protein [Flavobacterium sp. 102]RKS03407.1 copper chaperone CopZ [Flavobacterium sp. 102]